MGTPGDMTVISDAFRQLTEKVKGQSTDEAERLRNTKIGVRLYGGSNTSTGRKGKQIYPMTGELLGDMNTIVDVGWDQLATEVYDNIVVKRPSGNSYLLETIWFATQFYDETLDNMVGKDSKFCGEKRIVVIGNGKGLLNTDRTYSMYDDDIKSRTSDICKVIFNKFPSLGNWCGKKLPSYTWHTHKEKILTGYIKGISAKYNITFYSVNAGKNYNNTNSNYTDAKETIKTIGEKGNGKYFSSIKNTGFIDTIFEPTKEILKLDITTTPGIVFQSPNDPYEQREEVYYNLVRTSGIDYWRGNTKRYKLKLIDEGTLGKRPVVVDINDKPAIGNKDGYHHFLKDTFSWWNNTTDADGGDVLRGGVLQQISTTLESKPFTVKDFTVIKLDEYASLTNEDLNAKDDKERKSLLNFIGGVDVDDPSIAMPLEFGDSLHSEVSLVTYGKCKDGKENTSIVSCKIENLDQVALAATNDGFLRGYNVNNGKLLFSYMPYELLKNVKNLYSPKEVGSEEIKTYGLDNGVAIYLDDKDKNGYINDSDKAYAYLTMGRGGRNIYALDITQKNDPKLLWSIIGGKTSGYKDLGYTWSTPIVGKVRLNNESVDVIVFGGGYDPRQDASEERTEDKIGKGVYIVNAKTGALIWSSSKISLSNLKYSMPGGTALLKDEAGYITDFFIGDMGGQLWRFHIYDSKLMSNLKVSAHLVGSFAGDDRSGARRFYQTPSIYKFIDKKNLGRVSVNIGSGYAGHPLVTYNQDGFYSLNLPINYTEKFSTLKEDDLALLGSDGHTLENANRVSKTGFYIKFFNKGEKLISGILADFERVQFNTFIPKKYRSDASISCNLGIGTKNTYTLNLKTGKSLLQSLYETTSSGAIPPSPTLYCKGNDCSFVNGLNVLDKDYTSPKVVCTGNDCPVGTVVGNSSNYVDLCLVGGACSVKKTGWTDLFDLGIK